MQKMQKMCLAIDHYSWFASSEPPISANQSEYPLGPISMDSPLLLSPSLLSDFQYSTASAKTFDFGRSEPGFYPNGMN